MIETKELSVTLGSKDIQSILAVLALGMERFVEKKPENDPALQAIVNIAEEAYDAFEDPQVRGLSALVGHNAYALMTNPNLLMQARMGVRLHTNGDLCKFPCFARRA